SDPLVVPAAELGFWKVVGDPLAQPFGAAAAVRRIVIDMGVIVRDGRLRHDVVGQVSCLWAAIAHLSEMIGKVVPEVACDQVAHGCGSRACRCGNRLARITAKMPVRKIPSKVPAPPIEATGAPSPLTLSRLVRSAPIRVPSAPAM